MSKAKRDLREAVVKAALRFDAAWKNRSLTDEPVWEAANRVAWAAQEYRRSLRRIRAPLRALMKEG